MRLRGRVAEGELFAKLARKLVIAALAHTAEVASAAADVTEELGGVAKVPRKRTQIAVAHAPRRSESRSESPPCQ